MADVSGQQFNATDCIPIKAVSVTAGTPVDVFTPATGTTVIVMGYSLSLSVAGSVILKIASAHTEFLRTGLLAAGVAIASPNLYGGIAPGADDDHLFIDASASGLVSGFILVRQV